MFIMDWFGARLYFLLLLQDVHRCKAGLVLATAEAILPFSICRNGTISSQQTPKANIVHSFTRKDLFSLCFDTMLYGTSCVCVPAAHIDLVLVPCIGTSIDLEFSFRRCLQPRTAHWQVSEVLQKIQKKV
ncbi:hypothetical protein HDV63DRAFT_153265 [Trichoderma sp. SZMC 28014]